MSDITFVNGDPLGAECPDRGFQDADEWCGNGIWPDWLDGNGKGGSGD